MNAHILIVDDEESLTYFLKSALEEEYAYSVDSASTIATAMKLIQTKFPDLLLLDLNLPDGNGMDLYRYIQENRMDIPTVIITAHASVNSAVDAIHLGVDDYVIKPFDLDEIILVIEKQLKYFKQKKRFSYYKTQLDQIHQGDFFISRLPQIETIQNLCLKLARVPENSILIEGSSGTGKEMLARFIHQNSPNPEATFIEINCASLSEQLLESELFGYEPGAFTDAKKRKVGLIELASDGTLFLDEISEMNSALQAKLLRVIETRSFKRLGGISDIHINLRIIAATNRNIEKLVLANSFRKDLFYRLNKFHIKLPILTERREELLLISNFFLKRIAEKLRIPVNGISEDANKLILNYDWPGNFRELHNAIERAVILSESDIINMQSFPNEITSKSSHQSIYLPSLSHLDDLSLREYISQIEKTLLQQALQISGNNQLKAGDILKEPRHVIRRLIKNYGFNH